MLSASDFVFFVNFEKRISAVRVHGVSSVYCLMTISDSVFVLFVFLVVSARFRRFVSMVSLIFCIHFAVVARIVSVLLLSDNVGFLKPPDGDPWNVRQCQWWKPWINFVRMPPVCLERAQEALSASIADSLSLATRCRRLWRQLTAVLTNL